MTYEIKKLTVGITAVILLSSISMLAFQIQTVDAGGPSISDGDILVALDDAGTGGPGIIIISPSTGVQTFLHEFGDEIVGVDIDSNEDLIVAHEAGVLRYDPIANVETPIANAGDDLLSTPVDMDLNSAGDIIVLDDDGLGNGLVVSVDPVLGTETLLISDVLIAGASGLVVESSGDIIVLSNGELYRGDPIAGTVTLLSGDVFGGTEKIVIDDAGDIFTGGSEVVKTDPVTGTSTTISSPFDAIDGMGVESDGNIIVTDGDTDTIVYRVDPVSGAQTEVSSEDLLSGVVATAVAVKAAAVAPPTTCQNEIVTIVGTTGDDMLTGTAGDDVIDGLQGNDVITGLDGNDIICGGGGDDFIDGGNGNDAIRGNAGKDVIIGGEGNDFLRGESGKDNINGGSGNDIIEGGDQDDIIIGGSEDDDMDGGLGIDLCEAELNDTTTDCETISSI